jgi:hypothetical protein
VRRIGSGVARAVAVRTASCAGGRLEAVCGHRLQAGSEDVAKIARKRVNRVGDLHASIVEGPSVKPVQ